MLQPILRRGLLVASLLLCACAAPSVQTVPAPDLSVPLADPTLARVYLLRESQGYGKAHPVEVWIEEVQVGKLGPGHHLVFECPPGPLVLNLRTSGLPDDRTARAERVLSTDLEPGEIVYAAFRLEVGEYRPVGELLTPEAGLEAVGRSSAAVVDESARPLSR